MPAHVPPPEGDFDFGCSDFVWTPNQHRKVCRSCQEWHSSDPGEASDVVDVGILLICLYLLRELLQLFLNAGLVHRKKGVIEK